MKKLLLTILTGILVLTSNLAFAGHRVSILDDTNGSRLLANLPDCDDLVSSQLLYDVTTHQFICGNRISISSSPEVNAPGEIAFDTDLWGASRGSTIVYDGTAATALIGVLISDTPSDGEVPKFNTGGTITWETDDNSAGITCADTGVVYSDGADNPVCDATGLHFNKTTNTLTADAFETTPNTAPKTTYKDSDATAGDINAQMLINCTDAGDGTEDCDFTMSQQIAGNLTAFLTADADASITIRGTLLVDAGIDAVGNVDFDIGSADVDDITLITDGGTWVFDAGMVMPDANASPTVAGQLIYDNTITGLVDGAMLWYDDDEIRRLVDIESEEGDYASGDDGHVVTFNWNGGSGFFDLQASSSSVAYNSIGDPTGAGDIVFADTETALYSMASDGETAFTINLTDTDLAGNTIAFLITAVDDDDTSYIPFRIADDSGVNDDTLFQINQAGAITVGTLATANSVDSAQYVDGSIDLAHMSSVSVDSDNIVEGTILVGDMAANSIDSAQYVDGSIDLAHMSSASVDSDNIVNATIVEADIDGDEVPADNDILTFDSTGSNFSWQTLAELSIQPLDTELTLIAGLAETSGNVMFAAGSAWTSDATPAINCTDCTNIPAGLYDDIGDPDAASTIAFADTETVIWDTDSDGETFFTISGGDTDLGGNTVFLLITTIDDDDVNYIPFRIADDSGVADDTLFQINQAGAITVGTLTTANSIDSDVYVDGSIDLAHMSSVSVDSDNIVEGTILVGDMAANSIDSAQYVDGSIDLAHMSSASVDSDNIVADTITYADILDADQTDTKCLWFEDPVATDDFESIWSNRTANAFQVTEIWAESDQTVTFMLQLDDGTAADCDSVDLAPAAGTAEDTSLDQDCLVSADEQLDLAVTSVANTPTWVSICFTGNWVD